MSVADFQTVIGLEVHAQVRTQTKIFCGCSTAFGAEPNLHTCPVCMGFPGALPVLNRKVVEMSVRAGLALDCQIRERSVWARKNYFYPDLPKGYQISQYEQPICEHGHLTFEVSGQEKRVGIVRIHMEEDAGKNTHDPHGDSLVDFNRACTPLMEIVSAPDLRSSEEASEYLKALREILVYLGVNDGNLEEGSLRCDANVSVMRKGATEYGQRCEIKNLNSFRYLRQAVDYEVRRQVEVIEAGGKIKQETRLYDPDRDETRSMRSKEDAHDYRYFPEPDLLPLVLDAGLVEAERRALPELPRAKARRFVTQLGLPAYDAGVLVADRAVAEFFDACLAVYPDAKKLSNWFMGELLRVLKDRPEGLAGLHLTPANLGALLKLVDAGDITLGVAKEKVFPLMWATGDAPDAIVARDGLATMKDTGLIEAAVDKVIAASPAEVAKYKGGKTNLLGFFVGKVKAELKGKGDPKVIGETVAKKLS
jgi:aspartyl-tRNA(Asn)/glutamyl-tRNA(Gln) amidotransferase subunit B